MTEALLIAEAGLLLWLAWWLEPYHRPCFTLLILTMLSATGAYHIPVQAHEFQISASAQGITFTLAIGEGIWRVAGREARGRLLAIFYSLVFGGLFVVAEEGLDERFGWFITFYTMGITFILGMAVGAVTVLWDRHLAWLAGLAAIKPCGALAYFFLTDAATWWRVNDLVMGAMTGMMVVWILCVSVGNENRPS